MTLLGDAADLPDVEQRAVGLSLRQLLQRLDSHGPPPMPPDAESLGRQVPLMSSSTLREAVAKGYHVLSNAGLRGTLLGGLDSGGQHWAYISALALDELGKRETRVLEELADHPPAYLVAAIGRPQFHSLSGAASSRWSWTTVAAHVMSYRRHYAVSDPTRALGANPIRPVGLAQETDWRLVMEEIRWSAGNLGEHLIDPRVLGVFDPTGRVDAPQALAALSDLSVGRMTVCEARQRRIRAAPSHALRSEVTKALSLLRARPPDRSAELERLKATQDTLKVLYRQDQVSGMGRDRQPPDPTLIQNQRQLMGRLDELDAAITAARRDQGQRQAWESHNAEALAAGRLAAEELAGRESEALLVLEEDPPQHLTAELGRPPSSHAGRKAWRHGARLIEQYRTRHEVDDPTRPFGGVPEHPAQQAQLAMVRQALNRVMDSLQLTGAEQRALPPPPHELALGQ
jgi:hypothetical protein